MIHCMPVNYQNQILICLTALLNTNSSTENSSFYFFYPTKNTLVPTGHPNLGPMQRMSGPRGMGPMGPGPQVSCVFHRFYYIYIYTDN